MVDDWKNTKHMKKDYTLLLFLAFANLTIILQSCVGYNIAVETYVKPNTPVIKYTYSKANYKNIPHYEGDERPSDNYESVVRITVTGNSRASREKLINRMKKEASLFKADGVILLDEKYIVRESFNGFSLALNIVTIFTSLDDPCEEPTDLPVEDEYETLKMEGIAFRYKE